MPLIILLAFGIEKYFRMSFVSASIKLNGEEFPGANIYFIFLI